LRVNYIHGSQSWGTCLTLRVNYIQGSQSWGTCLTLHYVRSAVTVVVTKGINVWWRERAIFTLLGLVTTALCRGRTTTQNKMTISDRRHSRCSGLRLQFTQLHT
jgi:hypothetical protein